MSSKLINAFMAGVKSRNPNEPEFHQAVEEWAEVIVPFVAKNKKYFKKNKIKK